MGSWLSDLHFHCSWDRTWQGGNARCVYATPFLNAVLERLLKLTFLWFHSSITFLIFLLLLIYQMFLFCLSYFLFLPHSSVWFSSLDLILLQFFSSIFLNHLPIIHFITYWLFKTYWRNPFCKYNPFNWRGKEVTDTE